ncbi:apoptosis inhibitor IAP1 and related BIR domain proteins, partial [Moesziomyces antarcticus T-34]
MIPHFVAIASLSLSKSRGWERLLLD